MAGLNLDVTELFGTRLKGSVDALNAEPEHRYIGLRWAIAGDFLHRVSGPRLGANMANSRGVCEEIANHLVSGGINIRWPYSNGRFECFEVRPGNVKEVSRQDLS